MIELILITFSIGVSFSAGCLFTLGIYLWTTDIIQKIRNKLTTK